MIFTFYDLRENLPFLMIKEHIFFNQFLTSLWDLWISGRITAYLSHAAFVWELWVMGYKFSSGAPEHGHPGGPPIKLWLYYPLYI